jgi:hypothetical protein
MNPNWKLSLTLTTREGRIGTELIGSGRPMSWDTDGDDETVEATFALHDHAGGLLATTTIDGDNWRTLESEGRSLEDILKWVSHPDTDFTLAAAVAAAVKGVDPDGWTNAHERVLELQAELELTKGRAPTDDEIRAAFEHWFSDEGQSPAAVERRGGGYKLAQAQSAWQAWQAASAAYVRQVSEPGLLIRFENDVPWQLLRELTTGAIGWVVRINGLDMKIVDIRNDGHGPVYVGRPIDEDGEVMQGAAVQRVRFMDVTDLVIY